jgi:hypothetical protein
MKPWTLDPEWRTAGQDDNAAEMGRRAWAWLNAYGNSMRRGAEIICKTAGGI